MCLKPFLIIAGKNTAGKGAYHILYSKFYTGEWKLVFRKDVTAITYKKENYLWMRFEELETKQKIDSTRLLYQGDSKFIVDKNDEGFFVSRGPAKHLTSLYFHLRNGEAESFTPYYGFSVFGGYVKRKK